VISYEVANVKIGCVSWLNDFIGRFSRAAKRRPQKLANFVDRLTSRLDCSRASVNDRRC